MDVAIANYIRFKSKDGTYQSARNYQNFFVGSNRVYDGVTYLYAPFLVTGTVSTRGGDTPNASLVTVPNEITIASLADSIISQWLVEVKTVLLSYDENNVFSEQSLLSSEIWTCSGGNHDYEKAVISLSSPLDAARQQVPKRVLSTWMVGDLPTTGSIFAQ